MKRVGIIVAMRKELDAIQACGVEMTDDGNYRGETKNGTPFVIAVSGVGKVNAAVAACKLIRECGCTELLSFGCAGGLSYDVKVGDVVVGDGYMYYDVDCGSGCETGQVQDCPAVFASSFGRWRFASGYKHGLMVTGDMFVQTEGVASVITQSLYPLHCPLTTDMESASIAHVCHLYGVGFTSVRVVSDNPFSGERTYKEFWERKDEALSKVFSDFLEEE